MSKMNK